MQKAHFADKCGVIYVLPRTNQCSFCIEFDMRITGFFSKTENRGHCNGVSVRTDPWWWRQGRALKASSGRENTPSST
ncbi:hypothetical protein M407DRAFT_99083 [Tulasnella calospora MUT 4182]|uniref:Uncharacterized protein n=1 Tax=Tulasnella calospora MUT 4182 TaxID=1051891 RepID=A0A0C3Q5Y9_9AGAM|nr:hypothetical protein M407DRAFT_99083 [Tulasnella calospora MUT 4182]